MELMTVKKAAESLEVTPQAVYKRMREDTELKDHIQTDDKGVKKLTEQGLQYLHKVFNKGTESDTSDFNAHMVVMLREEINRQETQIKRLYDEMKELKQDFRKQLEVKDQQLERSQKLNENSQVIIQTMHQERKQLEAPGRKGLFDRFKKKESEADHD